MSTRVGSGSSRCCGNSQRLEVAFERRLIEVGGHPPSALSAPVVRDGRPHIGVEPRPDGRWARQKNGTTRAASLHDTQAAAETAARNRPGANAPSWFVKAATGGSNDATATAPTLSPRPQGDRTMPNTDDLKGRVKEAAGDLTDNDRLQREGKADQAAGKVKEAIDGVEDKATDVVDDLKDKLHRD